MIIILVSECLLGLGLGFSSRFCFCFCNLVFGFGLFFFSNALFLSSTFFSSPFFLLLLLFLQLTYSFSHPRLSSSHRPPFISFPPFIFIISSFLLYFSSLYLPSCAPLTNQPTNSLTHSLSLSLSFHQESSIVLRWTPENARCVPLTLTSWVTK